MKPIPDFEDYGITRDGTVYRLKYPDAGNRAKYKVPHKLSPELDRYGYLKVVLSKNHKAYYRTVHRLVAETYLPNPLNKTQINHKNGDKTDNRMENLEWCTAKENIHHAHRTNLHKGCRTAVIIIKNDETLKFESIVEASAFLKHDRHCFRRHLTTDSRHGHIDGWDFELIGGKERRKVIRNEDTA